MVTLYYSVYIQIALQVAITIVMNNSIAGLRFFVFVIPELSFQVSSWTYVPFTLIIIYFIWNRFPLSITPVLYLYERRWTIFTACMVLATDKALLLCYVRFSCFTMYNIYPSLMCNSLFDPSYLPRCYCSDVLRNVGWTCCRCRTRLSDASTR